MMSSNQEQRMRQLARKWLDGTITPEEAEEYARWYNGPVDPVVDIPEAFARSEEEQRNRILQRILADRQVQKAPVRRMQRLMKWSVAAAVIFLLTGTAGYWFFSNRNPPTNITAIDNSTPIRKDIDPGGNKAVLTLADGTHITLDSTRNGAVAYQGSVSVVKPVNGQLAYNSNEPVPYRGEEDPGETTPVLFNTVSTPRGGQYQVTLPDGTVVWLNAASSIEFPTVFRGNDRHVKATGEVYLKVARNTKQPFHVSIGGAEVQVLGTSFDINGYPDEGVIKTTLVEGKVRVCAAAGDKGSILAPGQQAKITPGTHNGITTTQADMEETLAWKNGLFSFNGANIQAVMRQLSRWYDVEVRYEGQLPPGSFNGEIGRGLSLSQVLKGLAQTRVNFRIEGKTLIIKP